MPFAEGQVVGPYQIISQLGQGGMATVYKAYHARLDRYVAIKIMHQAFQGDTAFLARFEREAQIVAKLEHPHIVPVYDYNEHEGQPFLVMKFVEGRTLKNLLSERPLALHPILDIMTPIASALTYAHRQGVLHRDIKPSNIILDQAGVPYLTDFGLARIAQAGESTMSHDVILGTPQYISPEQARGEKNLDVRTDIYSLGIVLYELVLRRVPFRGDTPYAIVHDHIYSDPPLPSSINPGIPPQVEAVLLKALAKTPADRYSSAVEMVEAFRQVVLDTGLTDLSQERGSAPARQPDDVTPSTVGPPQPPNVPGRRVRRDRRVRVERRFDAGDVDFGEIGKRVEEGIRQGAGVLGNIAASVQQAIEEREAALPEEERIRRRIEKRYKERQGLIIHFVAYLLVNLMLWGLWATDVLMPIIQAEAPNVSPAFFEFPWPIFPTFGWGIGMVAHFISYYSKYGPGAERRERAIQREIEKYRQQSGLLDEKPKRDPHYRLTDDGELEEVVDDYSQKRKRR
jgi:tRNA A-37 threonylcarbamoyl transferase component Bud32